MTDIPKHIESSAHSMAAHSGGVTIAVMSGGVGKPMKNGGGSRTEEGTAAATVGTLLKSMKSGSKDGSTCVVGCRAGCSWLITVTVADARVRGLGGRVE